MFFALNSHNSVIKRFVEYLFLKSAEYFLITFEIKPTEFTLAEMTICMAKMAFYYILHYTEPHCWINFTPTEMTLSVWQK